MTTNVIDFTEYSNRSAIEDLIYEAEESGDDSAVETGLVLLAMYKEGFLFVTYDEEGEPLFELRGDVSEEDLQAAEESFAAMDYEEML
jgi:hypothetical protein